MTLIDYFKQFEAVSAQWHFSANTRSLYIAILSKFNSELKYDSDNKCALYPAEMYLLNGELQKMSGVLSNSSFDAARGALIKSKLITYKKNRYALCGLENQCNSNGNVVENAKVTFEVEQTKERKKKEDLTPDAPRARGENSAVESSELKSVKFAQNLPRSKVSDEVAQVWQMWENRSMKMGEMAMLMHYEDIYGTAAVVAAIHEAGKCDKYDHLTLRFIETILNGKKKKSPEKKSAAPSIYSKED